MTFVLFEYIHMTGHRIRIGSDKLELFTNFVILKHEELVCSEDVPKFI